MARLRGILEAKDLHAVCATVDHSGEAAKVGITMPPTKLLIFGSPKAGTPVMLAAPSIALDLPLEDSCVAGQSRRGMGLCTTLR